MESPGNSVNSSGKRIWLDVGAHLGETTFETARRNPGLTVYAFEPNLRLASQRFGLLRNFIVLPLAVSENDAFSSFYVNSCDEASSLHEFNKNGLGNWIGGDTLSVDNEVVVPTTRLDTFMNRMGITSVEYLKIDAQGGDFNVLLSAGTRLADIENITLEVAVTEEQLYKGARDRTDIVNFMASKGFTLVKESPQSFNQELNMTFTRNHPAEKSLPENTVKGQLFGDHWIDICSESAGIGGSWQGRNPDGTPNSWDMKLVEFVYSMLKDSENPTILDVGANTGTFCFLTSVLAGLTCHAFEPAPAIYALLCKNIELNGLIRRIHAYNVAVSDNEEDTILKLPVSGKDSGLACIGSPTRFSEWTEFTVPTVTIDNWVSRNRVGKINMIKIDTEGCELLVLKGALQTLKQHKPNLLVEYNAMNTSQFGYHPRQIDELLGNLGYKGYLVTNEDKFYCSWDGPC